MKKEIWTYLEIDDRGRLLFAAKELLSKAQIIAGTAGEKEFCVCAVLAGADHELLNRAAMEAEQCGAESVFALEGEALAVYSAEYFSDAVGKLAGDRAPAMILFARTTDGMDLAPRLAAYLQTGMISDCVDVVKKDEGLVWIRHAFGGTVSAEVSFCREEGPQLISIRPGSFGGTGRGANAVRREAAKTDRENRTVFVPYIPQDCFAGRPGGRIIRPSLLEILEAAADRGKDPAAADVIVAGGNGAGPEGFKLIEELAELLHGAVGASRIAVDKGWISHSHLIGQSGITVAPSLYINCGISGSVQHIVGMRDAKCVISINKDPRALIFNVSDYGIVGDLHKVLPALIAEIRRHRA